MAVRVQVRADLTRLDYDLETAGRRVRRELTAAVGREALREAKRYWPVDTGRSRRGLSVRVRGSRIEWWNRWAYAIWVERRWFPLDRFFRHRLGRVLRRVERQQGRV